MQIIPKFIDEAAGPPAQAVGNTLANLWELGIGSHVSLWIKKQEIRQQQNLEDYIKKVEEKTQDIPEEFLKEPQLHIVGPAIEASKFYIESESLREMFANLIASSVDNRKANETHPSFVEIIKQLSPLDANILKNFSDTNQFPLVQVTITNDQGHYIIIQDHVMNFNEKQNYKLQASSLTNLDRLGLLTIDYSKNSTDHSIYDFIKCHPSYNDANEQLIEIQKVNPSYKNVDFNKGLCTRTPLCVDFIKVCF